MRYRTSQSTICRRLKDRYGEAMMIAALLFVLYYLFAGFVFNVRHPWATEMEIILHPVAVLTFDKVEDYEIRPRY